MKKKLLSHRLLSFLLSVSLCVVMCACAANTTDTTISVDTSVSAVQEDTPDCTSSYKASFSSVTSEKAASSLSSKAGSSSVTSEKTTSLSSSKASSSSVTSEKAASSSSSKASSSSVTTDSSESTTSARAASSEVTANSRYTDTTNSNGGTNTASTDDTQSTENTSSENEYVPESTETYSETYSETQQYYENENDFNSDTSPERTLPDKGEREKKIIVIDAGHQRYPNFETEPVAPGSWERKIKVSGGTTGVATGIPEYELTLALALKLQPILEERGYEVIQIRTSNDVNISNIERADVANNINADAFIRIHANGSDNSSVNGAMTLCQTQYNPNNGHIYSQCYSLSKNVLDELVASTGCNRQSIWETDTMCGINWSLVPVTIVEVGYMSNPQEDSLMSTDEYREKICVGIANGIDKFFEEQ